MYLFVLTLEFYCFYYVAVFVFITRFPPPPWPCTPVSPFILTEAQPEKVKKVRVIVPGTACVELLSVLLAASS